MAKQTFWAVQAHTKKGKALCWYYKKSKSLYFSLGKDSPPPALFTTKSEAAERLAEARKSKDKKDYCKELFRNELKCIKAHPVRVKISVS